MRNADKVEQYFLMQGFKKFIIHLQNFMILTLYSRKLTFWRLDHEQSCSHNKIVKVSKYAGLLDFFNIMYKSVNVIVILRTGLGRRNDSWMDDAKRKFKGYCDTWNKVGRTEIKEIVYLKCFLTSFRRSDLFYGYNFWNYLLQFAIVSWNRYWDGLKLELFEILKAGVIVGYRKLHHSMQLLALIFMLYFMCETDKNWWKKWWKIRKFFDENILYIFLST